MKICYRVLPALAAICFMAACAGQTRREAIKSGVEAVEADGFAPYNEKDLSATCDAAITEAQKNAIETVSGLFLAAQSKAEKYDVFKQNLLKTPTSYVKKHKVLSERREGDFYRVTIRAYVYVDKVASVLRGLSMTDASRPGAACAVMLDEYLASAVSPYGDARKAFTEYMGAKTALKFIDTPALKNSSDENSFLEAARASGADLVLIGRADAAPMGSAQGPQSGFYPARARAEMKIFKTGSRRLLLEISSQSNALDASQEGAFRKALAASGQLLGQEAFAKADEFIKPETPLILRVRGLNGIDDARKLKAWVDKMEVTSAAFESYSEGEAVVTLYPVRPDPQEFSSALLRKGVFNLALESVDQSEIVFNVVR